ncbi:MAG: ABC transporter permease [Microthrixaceae bacterium]
MLAASGFNDFLTYTVLGIATAGIYAIAAAGLVVTYTTSGIFNFAHGAVGMFSAYVYWQAHTPTAMGGWGWPTWVALLFVLGVTAPLLGAVIERLIMRGLDDAPEVVRVVVTVSLLLAMIGIVNWIWPGTVTRSMPRFFEGSSVHIGNLNVPYHRIAILVAAIVVAVVLRLLLYGTRLGVAMRAVVDDRTLARLNGIRPDRVSMYSWALGSTLAALAAIFVASLGSFDPLTLTLIVVNAFAVAVVGRLRSLPLTFLGAVILGLAEAYVSLIIVKHQSIAGVNLADIRYALPAILLTVAMLLQPHERLRAGGVRRVRERWRVPTMREAGWGAVAIVVVVAGIVSLIERDSGVRPVIVALYFAIICLSLVPLTGYAGQISLAQMSFVGLGAVVMNKIGTNGATAGALIVALAVCAVVGAVVALPALRLRGLYLALATAAFALFMSNVVFRQPKLIRSGNVNVPALDLGVFTPMSNRGDAMLLAVVFAGVGLFVVWLRRGPWGRRLIAMKDSQVACATLGLDLTRTKIGVFALSASIAGLAGALANRQLADSDFGLLPSMSVTTLAVVGGIGAVGGALLGGSILGTFNSFIPTLLSRNALGVFDYVRVSMENVIGVTPGFMGISLGRDPSGAVPAIGDAYRRVFQEPVARGLSIFGVVALWLLAKSGAIDNWTFVATIVVLVFAIMPLLPVLLDPIPGGRAELAGAILVAGLVAVGAIDWGTALHNNGMRILFMLIAAAVTAVLAALVHGKVQLDVVEMPSPDMVGVDRPITRSDVMAADRALRVTEAELHGTA